MVNSAGFVGQNVFVATTHFCYCVVKVARGSERSWLCSNQYLQKQLLGQSWPMVICQPVVQWKIDVKLQRIMLLQIVISALKLLLGFCEREGSGKIALRK